MPGLCKQIFYCHIAYKQGSFFGGFQHLSIQSQHTAALAKPYYLAIIVATVLVLVCASSFDQNGCCGDFFFNYYFFLVFVVVSNVFSLLCAKIQIKNHRILQQIGLERPSKIIQFHLLLAGRVADC